uniref:Uncharacterized protein n=1 Tax=Brassica oleracea var. oleracea TaxID=109376 RepID=A0A0D3CED8_BRAOL
MDYGARFHIIPNREALFDLQEGEGGKVLMGNDTYNEIKGVGKIRIRNPDGSIVVLNGVKYMPTMDRNLISYGCLEKAGCNYTGDKFKVKFYKDGKEVVTGIYTDGLYFFQGTVLKGEAHVSISRVDTTGKWHYRLGHLSLKNMEALVKQGYLWSKDVSSLGFCEECVLGKAHKQSFKKGKHTSEVLEYVHSD